MRSPFPLVVQYPRTVIILSLAISIFFGLEFAFRQVNLDGSPETLIIKGDQTARFYDETQKDFGDDRIILVAVSSPDLLSPDKIGRLRNLTTELANLPGVQQAVGLTTVQYLRSQDDTVRVSDLIPRDATAAELLKIKDEIRPDPLFRGHLISADGQTTAINLILRNELDDAGRRDLAQRVEDKVASERNWTSDIYATGEPIMQLHGTLSMRRDLLIFIPFTVALIVIVFYFSFRTWRGVLLPLLTVAMAVIWTLGLMAILGKSLTVVTLSLPVVILAIGSSYVIHVINQYYIATSCLKAGHCFEDRRAAVQDALTFIKVPVLVSGTITMAGFLSLASNEVQGSRELGYFAAFGMLAATVLALTFVPALLVLLKAPPVRSCQANYAPYLDGILNWLGFITTERRRAIYLGTILVCLIGLVGFTKLQVNTDYRAFFKKSSPVYQSTEKLHQTLAGAATFELVITADRPGAILQPQVLRSMQAVESFALHNGADATLSFADLMGSLNGALSGKPGANLPEDQTAVDNLYQDYLSRDESARRLIASDAGKSVILIRTDFYGSDQMEIFLSKVQAFSRAVFPATFATNSTGIFVLLNHASETVAVQQERSLGIALIIILAMVTILFRSIKLGIVAMIPNLIPILFTFGFMGWMKIDLNINTSLVASIVLGLAVDNAVHFIVRFVRNKPLTNDNKESVILSLMQSGKPIIFANLTLVFAFTIFILSQFNPIQISGLLSAVAIFACMIGNLVLLPVLLTHGRSEQDRGAGMIQRPPAVIAGATDEIQKEEIHLR